MDIKKIFSRLEDRKKYSKKTLNSLKSIYLDKIELNDYKSKLKFKFLYKNFNNYIKNIKWRELKKFKGNFISKIKNLKFNLLNLPEKPSDDNYLKFNEGNNNLGDDDDPFS
ncbi:MAG: hypothetical protein RsTaC01_1087 [Candidatus Paraimprobicoccus trichonymphae]|uniref:Uncharacterized protein n=1 Tax=Candidatus Paraimprobicoccus trichonymphae TaxID=3033793 RepID=A0AA48I3L0_9FIRM|nr:MAG: hypothetical protein RsTaC01_1087 [Candidatus Paraimprobicoccus trichonymphae]